MIGDLVIEGIPAPEGGRGPLFLFGGRRFTTEGNGPGNRQPESGLEPALGLPPSSPCAVTREGKTNSSWRMRSRVEWFRWSGMAAGFACAGRLPLHGALFDSARPELRDSLREAGVRGCRPAC